MTRRNSSKHRSPNISFSNNERSILENIQKFLWENYNIKGYISKKPKKKDTHNVNFQLAYNYDQALCVASLLNSQHPKKKHRINTILKYHKKVVQRNGKYTKEQLAKRKAYERLFFSTIFQ